MQVYIELWDIIATAHVMARPLSVLVIAGLVLAPAFPGARQALTRTVYVTAVDGKGAPVPDLTAADFVIKEDGKVREIVTAGIATVPLHVALMLDDSGLALGGIREGAAALIDRLRGKAEIALITIGGRNLTAVNFTNDIPVLYQGLNRILARGTKGAYLLDGLLEVSRMFEQRNAPRPVIVMIATEGQEFSNLRADAVLDALQRSGARMYYIGIGAPVTAGYQPAYGDNRAGDSTQDEAAQRNTVLAAGPQRSGGRSEQSLQPTGIPVLMKQFADELIGQYAIVFHVSDTKAGAKLGVEVKRRGVKVRAPARAGNYK